ncbi:MAG: hypothetical protein KAJ21_03845 [Thermoplasmatales archaeon]|nr:hypothetical protein [Thermoplasmatales archaeon]
MNKKIIGILIAMLFLVPISTVIADDDEGNGSNRAPCAPIIVEDSSGDDKLEHQCTFYSTDPDGDDLFYWIDWGDSNVELIQPLDDDEKVVPWDGPYDSGYQLSLNHKYSQRGKYEITIISKDIYDLESPETKISVTISYFKAFNLILERILNLFPILEDLFDL